MMQDDARRGVKMPETSKLADQDGANHLPDDIAFDNGLTELQNRVILALISTPTQQAAAASRVSAIRRNLDFAARGMELDNLEHRLASLDDHAAKNNHQS